MCRLQKFVMVAFTALLLGTGTGCIHEAYVADRAPPPPRVVVVSARPGYVWIDGRWAFIDDEWVWQSGYWARERPGYIYVQGRWVVRERHYHWRDGHFRHRHRHAPAPVRRPHR
jgi:hypothetical protein